MSLLSESCHTESGKLVVDIANQYQRVHYSLLAAGTVIYQYWEKVKFAHPYSSTPNVVLSAPTLMDWTTEYHCIARANVEAVDPASFTVTLEVGPPCVTLLDLDPIEIAWASYP